MKKTMLVLGGVVLVSCVSQLGPETIDVGAPNELGVTTLQIERSGDQAERVFELRGLDAAGVERASVRLHVGQIADLSTLDPSGDDNDGAEIVVDVDGNQSRWLSRETRLLHLGTIDDAVTQKFVELPPVARLLAAQGIVIDEPGSGGEIALSTSGCPTGYMNSSPTAVQCCYTSGASSYTLLMASSSGRKRVRNPYGTTCKASDGIGACSGTACYYGPNGFARPIFVSPGSGPYGRVESNGSSCSIVWYPFPQAPYFLDVTGTFPTNQGCPASNGSSQCNGCWDY